MLQAMTKLDPVQAMCLMGRYLMAMSDAEIGRTLNIHRRTVQRHVKEARIALVQQLLGA